ncbi:MAG: hypothetical protein ABF243_07775 [Celeribacter marinus]
MSDPMTNMTEDEDVLASIRRLVVDSRAARERLVAASETAGAPDLLLLTSDFLIDSPSSQEESDHPHTPPPLLVLGPHLAVVPREDTPAAHGDDDAQGIETNDEAVVDEASNDEESDAAWHTALDDTPNGEAMETALHLSLEQRIAGLETAIGASGDEWEPDGSENLEVEIPHQLPRGFADIVLGMRAKPVPTETPVQPEMHEGDAALEDDDLSAPESIHTDTALVDENLPYDDILDETMLRALVADVLNDELRGPLGERMTRNIRRLVRREVQRALSMRDIQ